MSWFSNLFGGPDKVHAKPIDLQKGGTDYLNAWKSIMPGLLGLEGGYRDDFGNLNLRDTRGMLLGSGDQPGLAALNRNMVNRAGNQLGYARGHELNRMTNQADNVRGLFQTLSPESAGMVNQAVTDANMAQAAAHGLSGQEQRNAQQFARESAASRGREMDNSALASEVLNRDSILGQKRQEAAQMTNNAFGMANQFYTQPGLQALYSTPQSYQAGQQMTAMGLGAIGANRPQMIDMGQGFNLAAADSQNRLGASMANAQAQSAQNAGMFGLFGGLAKSFF